MVEEAREPQRKGKRKRRGEKWSRAGVTTTLNRGECEGNEGRSMENERETRAMHEGEAWKQRDSNRCGGVQRHVRVVQPPMTVLWPQEHRQATPEVTQHPENGWWGCPLLSLIHLTQFFYLYFSISNSMGQGKWKKKYR